ncbi:MAG TPA: Uma2 family endonuclease [Blastocatellia bacterium]|nr:Uma2 family endonuclease [Blastocatellia bacterium]
MSVATTDYLAAIEHLPAGAALRMDDVTWEEYEQLLADLGDGYAARIFYDQGRMEIVATNSIHERSKAIIHSLLMVLSDELDMDVEGCGSTTFREKIKAKGAEPDKCFYVQNASAVIGKKEEIDLRYDPPPDIVVEVDRTSASLNKFNIYSGLGVPEIWRVKGRSLEIHLRAENNYEQSLTSRAFPSLSAQTLSEFLAQGFVEGERKTASAFRDWVRQHYR